MCSSDLEHVQYDSAQEKQRQTTPQGTAVAVEANHADTCNHSHCGHGHTAGFLTPYSSYADSGAATALAAAGTSAKSSHIANNIERPKWPFTTPAVVNLLS